MSAIWTNTLKIMIIWNFILYLSTISPNHFPDAFSQRTQIPQVIQIILYASLVSIHSMCSEERKSFYIRLFQTESLSSNRKFWRFLSTAEPAMNIDSSGNSPLLYGPQKIDIPICTIKSLLADIHVASIANAMKQAIRKIHRRIA